MGRKGVHQEADGTPVHSVDPDIPVEMPMQGLKHEAIATQGNDDPGIVDVRAAVEGDKLVTCRLCADIG